MNDFTCGAITPSIQVAKIPAHLVKNEAEFAAGLDYDEGAHLIELLRTDASDIH